MDMLTSITNEIIQGVAVAKQIIITDLEQTTADYLLVSPAYRQLTLIKHLQQLLSLCLTR